MSRHDYDDDDHFDPDCAQDPDEADMDSDDEEVVDLKLCPYCGQEVFEEAGVCPHCRSYIPRDDVVGKKRPLWITITAIITLIALLAGAIWLWRG